MAATAKKDAASASAAAAAAVLQMKLLVDKRSRRVLYAEARKDAVDFLIGLLRVPAGLAARVIAKHAAAAGDGADVQADEAHAAPGSLGTLYAGARALDDAFFVAAAPDRDAILCPALPSAALALLLAGEPAAATPPPAPPAPPKRYFRCAGPYGTSCRGNPTCVTDVAGLPCPVCRQPMTVEMRWSPGDAHGKLAQAAAAQEASAAAASAGAGGYVKEVVSYLVMDDLTVEPMSTISAIMLLKKFKVADCSVLEELTVDLGHKEAVLLLKAALESKTALTDVFCGGVSIDRLDYSSEQTSEGPAP